jgi:threonine dehydratase
LQAAAAGKLAGKRVVVLVCGGNVSADTLRRVLAEDASELPVQ